MFSIGIGLIASFYAFWNSQFGVYYWRWGWWLAILVEAFILIAYGAYLVSESAQTVGGRVQRFEQPDLNIIHLTPQREARSEPRALLRFGQNIR